MARFFASLLLLLLSAPSWAGLTGVKVAGSSGIYATAFPPGACVTNPLLAAYQVPCTGTSISFTATPSTTYMNFYWYCNGPTGVVGQVAIQTYATCDPGVAVADAQTRTDADQIAAINTMFVRFLIALSAIWGLRFVRDTIISAGNRSGSGGSHGE